MTIKLDLNDKNVWCLWQRDAWKRNGNAKWNLNYNEIVTFWTSISDKWKRPNNMNLLKVPTRFWLKIDSSKFIVCRVWAESEHKWHVCNVYVCVCICFTCAFGKRWVKLVSGWVVGFHDFEVHINVYVNESMKNQFHYFTCNQMKSALYSFLLWLYGSGELFPSNHMHMLCCAVCCVLCIEIVIWGMMLPEEEKCRGF